MSARKRRTAWHRTRVDDEGYLTDGMFRWHPDFWADLRKKKRSSIHDLEQAREWQNKGWAERIADIRAWLTEIIAPYWEGPFQFEEVWRVDMVGREICEHQLMDGEAFFVKASTGTGYYRMRNADQAALPGYVHDVMSAFSQIEWLEKHLTDADKLDLIFREALELGETIERVLLRENFAPLVTVGMSRHKASQKAIAIVNEAHAELRSQYQSAVDTLMANGESYSAACEKVASSFGVSDRTVRDHTTNPAPRNRGRWQR